MCFACERYSNNYHQAFVGNLITSLLLLMEQVSSMKCELTAGPLPVFCQIHLGLVSSHSDMGPAPPRCPCPWCWLRCTCRRSDQDGKVPARENGASSLTLPRRCLQHHCTSQGPGFHRADCLPHWAALVLGGPDLVHLGTLLQVGWLPIHLLLGPPEPTFGLLAFLPSRQSCLCGTHPSFG